MSITISKHWTQKNSTYSALFGRSQVSDNTTPHILAQAYKLINKQEKKKEKHQHVPFSCILNPELVFFYVMPLSAFARAYTSPTNPRTPPPPTPGDCPHQGQTSQQKTNIRWVFQSPPSLCCFSHGEFLALSPTVPALPSHTTKKRSRTCSVHC